MRLYYIYVVVVIGSCSYSLFYGTQTYPDLPRPKTRTFDPQLPLDSSGEHETLSPLLPLKKNDQAGDSEQQPSFYCDYMAAILLP